MNYDQWIKKHYDDNPLHCYTELVTIGEDCARCDEHDCPFRELLDYLKESSRR